MEQKSLKKNAFYSVLRVFLSLVFPLITFPYASRILLPEGIGKVNFANTITTYFVLIASLGIGSYATREAVKLRDNKQALTKFFKEIISINIVCCFIAYILFFVSLYFIPKFSDYRDLLLICSIKIFFSVLGIEWLYNAFEEFKYLTVRSFLIQLFSLIYLFVFVHTKEDIIHYAIFGLFLAVGNNVLNFIYVGKYIDISYKTHLEIKKHFKSIIVSFGITIVTSIYTLLDTTMLGFLSTDIEVGYYTASTKLGHMVLSMLTAITAVLFPRLTDYAKNNEKEKFIELVKKCINILILLSIPNTSGIIILSKPLILLLSGEEYLPSILSMQIISPIVIIISFGSLIGAQILPAIGKEKISFYSYIVGAITNISLNVIFIPKLGASGAAIGTVFAEFAVTLIQILYVRDFFKYKEYLITLFESIISSFIMLIIIYIIISLITNPLIQLLISFIAGILIYSICLILLRNKYFLLYFNKLLNYISNKLKRN